MDSSHKEIYGRYLKKSHTWRLIRSACTRTNYAINSRRYGYIITSFYVPEETTEFIIKIECTKGSARVVWREFEQSIESILVESKRIPDISNLGYKRIVPCEPFIYLPNSWEFEISFGDRSWRECYYEYYQIHDCTVDIPFPSNDCYIDIPWADYIHILVPTDIRKIGDRLRIDLINEVEDLCDDLTPVIYDESDA